MMDFLQTVKASTLSTVKTINCWYLGWTSVASLYAIVRTSSDMSWWRTSAGWSWWWPNQSVVITFLGTKYEYEYIWNILFNTNTNTNIFVSIKRSEYEYSNIFGSNIRILFDEYSNIPWNAAIDIKFCIPKIPRSQFNSPHGNILGSS